MKKLQLCIVFLVSLCLASLNAQENGIKKKANYIDINVGSASLGGGMQGYGTNADFPDYYTETISPLHVDLGYRRMYNSNLGWIFDVAYDQLKHDDTSKPFKASLYSARLQGYVNVINLLSSRAWAKKFGFAVHAGLGYSGMSMDKNLLPTGDVYDKKNWDNIMNGIVGGKLAYRLGSNSKWEIHADYSVMWLGKVQTQLDGSRGNHGHIDGHVTNISLGTSVLVGKNKTQNFDWEDEGQTDTDLEEDESEYDAALADLMVDMNNMKSRLEQLEQNQNVAPTPQQELNLLKAMFDEELVYAFFDFNESEPNPSSNQAFILAVKYMNAVPSGKLLLKGYADKIGSNAYNDQLALHRAERCKGILQELGVDGSRISIVSEGKDMKHNASSVGARQVVRRVQFSLQ